MSIEKLKTEPQKQFGDCEDFLEDKRSYNNLVKTDDGLVHKLVVTMTRNGPPTVVSTSLI